MVKKFLYELWNEPFDIIFKAVRILIYLAALIMMTDWVAELFYQHFISGVK